MVNVGKYTIHGCHGSNSSCFRKLSGSGKASREGKDPKYCSNSQQQKNQRRNMIRDVFFCIEVALHRNPLYCNPSAQWWPQQIDGFEQAHKNVSPHQQLPWRWSESAPIFQSELHILGGKGHTPWASYASSFEGRILSYSYTTMASIFGTQNSSKCFRC